VKPERFTFKLELPVLFVLAVAGVLVVLVVLMVYIPRITWQGCVMDEVCFGDVYVLGVFFYTRSFLSLYTRAFLLLPSHLVEAGTSGMKSPGRQVQAPSKLAF
jgi:hypothetical protein